METIKDLISVVIPTFNRAHLIKRSAQSVLDQTYNNLELIIVDDGSTDNTEDVVKSIDDERVIYIKQTNQGACAARNNGIDHAKGEFIAFQDSDDVWHEDKLEKQIKCLKQTGADMVVCKVVYIKKNTSKNAPYYFTEGFIPQNTPPFGLSTQTFFVKKFVFESTIFDRKMPKYQDFEFLIRCQKYYNIYFMNEILVNYYLQADSITVTHQNKIIEAWNIIFDNNPDFRERYALNRDLVAKMILEETCKLTDKSIIIMLEKLAFSFSKSLSVKFSRIVISIKRMVKQIIRYHH